MEMFSYKSDDTLFVKASGTWLGKANESNIFVSVPLPQLLEQFRTGNPDPVELAF